MPILLMDNSQAHLWLTCPRENLFQLFCVCERDLHNYENYAYVVISWVFSLTYYQLSPYYGKWQFSNLTCLSQNIFSLFSSVQLISCVWLFATPQTAAHQASLSITNSWSPLKPMSIVLVLPSNHLILCLPLILLSSTFSSIRVFSNELALRIRWPKYWSFSFIISDSNEYSGLIPFRIDWLDLLAVQGTLKSLLRHHSLKASILQHSASFMV